MGECGEGGGCWRRCLVKGKSLLYELWYMPVLLLLTLSAAVSLAIFFHLNLLNDVP